MPIKYCTFCAAPTEYSFEAPIKCVKCHKDFAAAFASTIITKKTEPKQKFKTFATTVELPESDDQEDFDNMISGEGELDYYKEQFASLIDLNSITVNIGEDDVVRLATDKDGQVSLGRKRFEVKETVSVESLRGSKR